MNCQTIHDIEHASERPERVCQCGAITRDWLTVGPGMYECESCRAARDRQDARLKLEMLADVPRVAANKRGPLSDDFYDGMRGCKLRGIE